MLRKRMIRLALWCFISVLAYAGVYAQQKGTREITIASKSHLSVHIKPGPEFSFNVLFFIKRPATIACWLETTNGLFVDTVFVSQNAKKGEWYGHPEGQPGALPVWSYKAANKKNDAISGATLKPGEGFATNADSVIPVGSYVVKFEVNKPYDYNDAFPINLPKNDLRYSGYNGQPSLIYEGTITIGKESNSSVLKLTGTGSPNGQDGEIHDLTGITTALKIIDSVEVRYGQ